MEILESIQKKILILLKDLPDIDAFYLTGGTALSAFYLGHRKSNDLDFFTTTEELILPFSFKMEETLRGKGFNVKRERGFRSFVELFVNFYDESTIMHIALDSPFRFEHPKESTEFPGLKIDSLIDIATNKLLTLFGRATLRDFIDVYFLVREKLTQAELIDKAKIKDPGLDIYWLGVAFERINEFFADSPEMLLLVKPCMMKELQDFFNGWRRGIYKDITNQ
ncbi:MAG: nucleotidyl transferase AbiEii/AbiGii toxin family protein [Nitrospirota bacterium]